MIYIGYIGDGSCTSLYDRFKGHGSGSHCQENWYNEISYIKYLNLPNFSIIELQKLERICINFNKNCFNYNDKIISKNDLVLIKDKLLNNNVVEKKPEKHLSVHKTNYFIQNVLETFKDIIGLKRFKAYFISFIIVIILFGLGLLFYLKYNDIDFVGNIFCSIGASVLASIIVGILIDLADKKRNDKNILNSYYNIKWLIGFYTLNFNFEFIIKSFNKRKIKIETNKSSHELFIEAVDRTRLYNKDLKVYNKINSSLYNSCIYHLRMILEILSKANFENVSYHHFENYIINFMDIKQYIEQFLLKQTSDNAVAEIANIIDLLMNLDFQSEIFEQPINKYSNQITLYGIYIKDNNGCCN